MQGITEAVLDGARDWKYESCSEHSNVFHRPMRLLSATDVKVGASEQNIKERPGVRVAVAKSLLVT